MDYGEVLSRAWRIIWKHKILWIFGIMAGCTSGSSNGSNINFGSGDSNFNNPIPGTIPADIQRFFDRIGPEVITLLIIGGACIALVFIVLAIFLGITGRTGLIRGTLQADQEAEPHLRFGELFRGSLPFFWRQFLLGLLVFGLILVAILIGLLVAIPATVLTLGLGLLCLIPFMCLLIPIFAAVQVVVEQSSIAIVVENLGVIDGLRRGWEVVKTNPLPMLLMWLILNLGIGLLAGIILFLPLALASIPMFVSLIRSNTFEFGPLVIISMLCTLAYLPVLIVLGGALTSYIRSAWTLTYLRLTGRSAYGAALIPAPEIEPPASAEIFSA